ncbi:MAG: hypothetical protein HP491_02215 [Nitrospira sp.]|nr:hypothetical protein [Nitrospira sp.]MBH0183112.1 hypothetical protein [Nitrospira sp.]
MSFELLLSQRNELFRLIQDQKLSPADFELRSVHSDESDNFVPVVTHTATEFHFSIELNTHFNRDQSPFLVHFSPGNELHLQSEYAKNWHEVTQLFSSWLDYVKRETELPDLWSGLQDSQFLQEQPSDNLAFSPEELSKVRESLDDIKAYVLGTYEMTATQRKIVESRFDHMEEAASRMGRKDWFSLVVGNLIGVASTLALTGDSTKDLLGFAVLLIKKILGTVLYLAGPH